MGLRTGQMNRQQLKENFDEQDEIQRAETLSAAELEGTADVKPDFVSGSQGETVRKKKPYIKKRS